MKKSIALLLVVACAFICGCETKSYTPDITSQFSSNAVVTSGDFSYQCIICRKGTIVTVKAASTSAKGLNISYDGKTAYFDYQGMQYQMIDAPSSNPAVAVYDVFDYITSDNENFKVKKTDDGFRYEGETKLGRFILYQNKDGSYSSLHFLNSNLLIEFLTK